MQLLLLLLLLCGVSSTPIAFEFEIEESRYYGSIYVVELEDDPETSEYPLSTVQGLYRGLPQSTIRQMGTAVLACVDTSYPSIMRAHAARQHSHHSLEEARHTRTFDPISPVRQYVLEGFVPLPPIRHPLVSAYMLLAGAEYDASILSETTPFQFVGMKVERVQSLKTGDTAYYVDSQYNASLCEPLLIYNTTGTNRNTTTATCSYAKFQEESNLLSNYVSQLDTGLLTKEQLQQRLTMAEALVYQNTYHACVTEIEQDMVLPHAITEMVYNSERCYEPYASDSWNTDPCCNRALRFKQCCAPRTRMVTLELPEFVAPSQCSHPEKAVNSYTAYARSKADAKVCEDQARASGATFSDAASLTQLIPICYTELFGDLHGLPTCLSDENCYTRCDQRTGRCIPPYDDPEPPLWRCIADNAHPLLLRIWKRQWHNSLSLREHLYEAACTGPTASEYNGDVRLERVPECTTAACYCIPYSSEHVARDANKRTTNMRQGLRRLLQREDNPWDHARYERAISKLRSHTRVMGTQQHECYQVVNVAADKEACLSDMRCNWDQSKSLAECSGGALTTRFCGECQSGPCWDVSSQPMCYTQVSSPHECSQMGGAIGPWGLWHCVFGTLTSEEQCLPLSVCPPRPGLEENREMALGDRYCASSCTVVTANCSEVGGWWNSQIARCTLPLDREACLELETTEWFPGRTFRPGILNTQPLCEKGRCSMDARLSAEECATTPSCTKTCTKCTASIPGSTLCHTHVASEAACKGQYNAEHQACIFTNLRTEDECLGASNGNYTFECCSSLSTSSCMSMSGFTAVAQAELSCYVDRWQTCNTREECEASGDCSDWELQNWYDRERCWGTDNMPKSPDCTGVCVFPYTGTPHCDAPRVYTKMGCVDYALTQSTVCTSSGGNWQQRAFTQRECNAHGKNCDELFFLQPTPKTDLQCHACAQGRSQDRYEWVSGEWKTGQLSNVSWVLREFTSINRWQSTLNWARLNAYVEQMSLQAIVDPLKSSLMCKFNLEAMSLRQLVCNCMDGHSCYTKGSRHTALGQQGFYKGVRKRALWSHVQIEVVHTRSDYVMIKGDAVLPPAIGDAHKRSPYAPNQYEVITNHVDYVVGQLISDGVSLVIPPNTTINVCINVNQGIPRDPENIYPTVDFAAYNASIPKWWPVDLVDSITVVGNFSQVCANVNTSGTYFAILRLDDWAFATGTLPATTTLTGTSTTAAATTSTTTSGNTSTTTLATTVAPTLVTVESNLTGATIVVIILASVAGVALLAVLIACCATHSSGRKRIGKRITRRVKIK